jgi:hypothetical protein
MAVFLLGTILPASPQSKHVPVWPRSEAPLEFATPDWSDKMTWVKVGLLVGAAVLVKLSLRKMDDDEFDDER